MTRLLVPDITKNHQAWMAQKMLGIGSGDIATIVGANEYQTPLELWSVKTRRSFGDDENEYMWWGRVQEEPIAQLAGRVLDLDIQNADAMYGHDEITWAQATPDRFGRPKGDTTDGSLQIIECKNIGWRKKPDWDEGKTPLAPVMQVQWQMGICGIERGIVAPLVGGDIFNFSPREVEFDKSIFEQIVGLAERFKWFVDNDTPPGAKAEDTKLVDKIVGELQDKITELAATPENIERAQKFLKYDAIRREHNELAKEAAEISDEAKNNLRLLAGNAKTVKCGNYMLRSRKQTIGEHVRSENSFTKFEIFEFNTGDTSNESAKK